MAVNTVSINTATTTTRAKTYKSGRDACLNNIG